MAEQERISIFIDGSNLYRSLKRYKIESPNMAKPCWTVINITPISDFINLLNPVVMI